MTIDTKLIEDTFEEMCSDYGRMLNNYYPPFGSNDLTGRNLLFNFCHNMLKIDDELIIYQEIPIGKAQHVNSLIMDENEKVFFLIEAKRLNNIKEIEDDCDKMLKNYNKFNGYKERKHYGKWAIILVDLSIPNDEKKAFEKKQLEHMFHNYKPNSDYTISLFSSKKIAITNGTIPDLKEYFILYKAFKIENIPESYFET